MAQIPLRTLMMWTVSVRQKALTGTVNWKSVEASPLGIGWQMSIGAGIGAVAWRNNVLIVNAMGSSARFAAGTGFSSALAGGWTTVKGWFSKLFK